VTRSTKRLAAIDIGTNSIRCIVVEVGAGGVFRILDDEKATVRLGENLGAGRSIATAAWERAMDNLLRMKKIIDGYGVVHVEAVATSAVRQADNGLEFVQSIHDRTGLAVRIIPGEEEARLVSLSVLHNFDLDGIRYGMVDIGGGSVEIVTAVGNRVEEYYSLELGAVTLTERFLPSDPITEGEQRKLVKQVRASLHDAFADDESVAARCLVASGGTITSVAAMIMAARGEAYDSVHGYEVLRSDIVHLLAMLVRKDVKERRSIAGLNPDRADIIVAGVLLLDELMKFFGANILRVNERGIREGLILDGLRKHGLIEEKVRRRTWRSAVQEFSRSCMVDEEHARQVARLSLELLEGLDGLFTVGDRERRLLEAAALLHDTGYFINYSSHHKHSYHLIRHADLFGFTPRERELIAIVARYHRKSLPKKKHEGYVRLADSDRDLVSRLGGILRLADGLDRRRISLVKKLSCEVNDTRIHLRLAGEGDLSVELYGGKEKSDLFVHAFGRDLELSAV
jgi:exopolyphosphatase / guanosine-5'-triphosphate,3'-diphosphate pyrophosphatase